MSFGVYWESGWTMMMMSAPSCQGQPVAAFLIAAVAEVFLVGEDDGVGKASGDGGGFVAAGVIDDDDLVHDVLVP